MSYIFASFLTFSVFLLLFLLLPVGFGRTGGYRELVDKYKTNRPNKFSSRSQTIYIERGFGGQHDFTGVKYLFTKDGFYISPMFKVWSFCCHQEM